MSDITREDVQTWILNKASDEDLKLLQELLAMKLRLQFQVGDSVWFDAGRRGVVHGKIVKMNAKSAKVETPTGLKWTVAPGLLQKDAQAKVGV